MKANQSELKELLKNKAYREKVQDLETVKQYDRWHYPRGCLDGWAVGVTLRCNSKTLALKKKMFDALQLIYEFGSIKSDMGLAKPEDELVYRIPYLIYENRNEDVKEAMYNIILGTNEQLKLKEYSGWLFSNLHCFWLSLFDLDTSEVKNMDCMFLDVMASELKGLEGFKTSSVTSMYGTFSSCITSTLDLRTWDMGNVENMESMFAGSKIVSLRLSNTLSIPRKRNLARMFAGAEIINLDLSYFNVTNDSDVTDMFKDSYVKNLVLSDSLKSILR